jgi:hypothetical protein
MTALEVLVLQLVLLVLYSGRSHVSLSQARFRMVAQAQFRNVEGHSCFFAAALLPPLSLFRHTRFLSFLG